MADAATTAEAVRTDAGADHSFLWRRLHGVWVAATGRPNVLSLATLSILFQMRFGAVGG